MRGGDLVREAELLSYDVLDKPPIPALEELASSAAEIFGTAMAEVNAVTATETVHLATSDRHAGHVPKEQSFCGQVVGFAERTWVVPDALEEPLVNTSPYVAGPLAQIRFYAGTQLRSESGVVLGTLCVWDDATRGFTDAQVRQLELMGDAVSMILQMHRTNVELAGTLSRLATSHRAVDRTNESLEAFAGQISHDLQSPLATVRLAIEMLGEEAPVRDDDELSFLVRRALGGAGRMHRTIEDLMDFAVLGGGASREEVDLGAIAAEVVADLAATAGTAEITIGPLPRAVVNASQARAVIQNLVTNAVKFAVPHTTPRIAIEGRVDGGTACVSVSDNGPGVPPDKREAIFQMMVRGDQEEVAGHGIGLATCARIVEAHGGRIGVDQAVGGGARFWFELPAA